LDLLGEGLVVDPLDLGVVVEFDEVEVEHLGHLVRERVAEPADETRRYRGLAAVDLAAERHPQLAYVGVVLQTRRVDASYGTGNGSDALDDERTEAEELALLGEGALEERAEGFVLGELDVQEGVRDVDNEFAVGVAMAGVPGSGLVFLLLREGRHGWRVGGLGMGGQGLDIIRDLGRRGRRSVKDEEGRYKGEEDAKVSLHGLVVNKRR